MGKRGVSMAKKRGELLRVTRIVGEKEVQVVERATCAVPECAQPVKKVIDVMVDLIHADDDLFSNKAVKEGAFQVQILYVSNDEYVRHASLYIPFIADAEIPGAHSGMQVQHEVLFVEKSVNIVTDSVNGNDGEIFDVKIVVGIRFRVVETVDRKLESCRRPQGQNFTISGCRGEFRNQYHR